MNGHAMEYCPKKISKFLLLHGHDKAAKKSTPKTFAGNILVRIFFGWDKSCQSCDLKK